MPLFDIYECFMAAYLSIHMKILIQIMYVLYIFHTFPNLNSQRLCICQAIKVLLYNFELYYSFYSGIAKEEVPFRS